MSSHTMRSSDARATAASDWLSDAELATFVKWDPSAASDWLSDTEPAVVIQ